jgi:hypothetical protein
MTFSCTFLFKGNVLDKKSLKAMGLLLAANMEAVLILVLAAWCGQYLNRLYPLDSLDWIATCLFIGVLVVVISWVFIWIKLKSET